MFLSFIPYTEKLRTENVVAVWILTL